MLSRFQNIEVSPHKSSLPYSTLWKARHTLIPSIHVHKPLLIRIIDVTIQNKTLLTRQSNDTFSYYHKNCHKLIQKLNQNQSKTWNKVYKWYYIRWYTSTQRIHTRIYIGNIVYLDL